MVGMPLLNLGYALGGLTGGYNQAQTQAMQRAAQQLALQQAQAQIAGRQALSRYLQSPDFKGFGGGLGGAFSPGNIQPVSQPAPAPAVTTPSPAPVPPVLQQPMSASPRLDTSTDAWAQQSPWWAKQGGAPTQEQVPDSAIPSDKKEEIPLDTPSNGQKPATSAPPVPTTADTQPAPGPASDATPSSTTPSTTAPASTTSDASSGAGGGGGDSFAIKIPGGPSIPLSQFFGTLDYGELAKGIAKYVPPGTDQSAIYEAVLDLSKLAEGNRTQQQQAGLILRQLMKEPFDLEKIQERTRGQLTVEEARSGHAMERTQAQIAGRAEQGALNRQSREGIAAASRNLRSQDLQIKSDRERRLADKQIADLERFVAAAGLNNQKAQLSAIRAQILGFKPAGQGGLTFTEDQQKQLNALIAKAAAIGEQIAAQAATAAPAP